MSVEKCERVAELLEDIYPDAVCELHYQDPWQLLVATVLSAQCTDARVNKVTPVIFDRWPEPVDLMAASLADIEDVIHSTGLFRSKAKNLKETAARIVNDFGGQVPRNLDEMISLPGVGRKTAKVVLGEAFGIPAGIAVDTHVNRLSRRLGLTTLTGSDRISAKLEQLLDRQYWIGFSLRLVLHGRRVCTARNPQCEGCGLRSICPQIGV